MEIIMKKHLFVLAGLIMGALPAFSAYAEDGVKSIDLGQQEIQLTITAIEVQRKAMIAQGLQLAGEENGFWKVYNDYRAKMKKVIDSRVEVITDYADAYRNNSLSDKDAAKLLDRYLKSLQNRVKVKKNFVRKFKKVLPAKKVARFYQLDHRIDLLVDMQIARGVPLVE